MQQPKLWLTGATGFVGSHFLYHVLKHSDVQVVALVRGRRAADTQRRLLDTLESVAASYGQALARKLWLGRLQVVEGDITLPRCGVDPSSLPFAPGEQDSFWHMAASLQFEEKYADEIRLQNVTGTHNALALARGLGVASFVYVSTAYSCGRREGPIAEQLHALERPFCNVYEQTKCEAEHAVANWGARTSTRVSILRPSIVVGPRSTHQPGGSDTGLYGFVREIFRMRRTLLAAGAGLSLLGDPQAPVHLVPVDDVVREMWSLAEQDFCGQLVHHVTSAQQPSVGTLLRTVGGHCGGLPIRAVLERSRGPSPVEEAIDRRARFYSSYLRDAKSFERAHGTPIAVSDRDLDTYVHEYLRRRRQETADSLFELSVVARDQGPALRTFRLGAPEKPALVLCNALGMPADIWVPLAQALKTQYSLLTWESSEDEDATTPETQLDELRSLLDHHGVARAFLVGWCTGADTAALFAERYPSRVLGLVSLSGALNDAASERTPFQRALHKLVMRASEELKHAELYHGLLFGHARAHYGMLSGGAEKDQVMLSSMVRCLDPSLLHLTSAPFRDGRALYRYARSMRAYYERSERHGPARVRVPALVVTGGADDVAHPDASRRAAAAWGATLLELPQGDHFSLYHDPELAHSIARFAEGVLAARRVPPAPLQQAESLLRSAQPSLPARSSVFGAGSSSALAETAART